jgi:hypothetical protein
MAIVDRHLALMGLGAASAVLVSGAPQAYSQPAPARTRTIAQGVQEIVYGEGPSIIPGYKTVRLRDIVVQPAPRSLQDKCTRWFAIWRKASSK